jgi:hypothetical protein
MKGRQERTWQEMGIILRRYMHSQHAYETKLNITSLRNAKTLNNFSIIKGAKIKNFRQHLVLVAL